MKTNRRFQILRWLVVILISVACLFVVTNLLEPTIISTQATVPLDRAFILEEGGAAMIQNTPFQILLSRKAWGDDFQNNRSSVICSITISNNSINTQNQIESHNLDGFFKPSVNVDNYKIELTSKNGEVICKFVVVKN